MSHRAFLPGQLRLILAMTLVHVLGWFAYFSQIPAGNYPSEAAHSTLEAAIALADAMPTSDSGHSLYTYILSLLAHIFGDTGELTSAARGLNALALVIAAGFTASAAGEYWRRNRAVWIGGLLVGLNPVLVFWAGEVSPILLATACTSSAFYFGQRWMRRSSIRDSLRIAVCFSLASLLETTLLPIALLWPFIAYLLPHRERVLHFILALIPTAVIFSAALVFSLQLQDSFQWGFEQIGQGMYRALGYQESYDDKSFSLYRQLHFILFLNPIHWGALFILAVGGAYVRLKDGHRGRSILLALLTLTLFALSLAVNQSGTQARASLLPLLAIMAGGITLIPKIWKHAGRPTRRKILIGAVLIGIFVYAGLFIGTPQSHTWERDYVYLAEANIHLGNNGRATTWAEKALELNPTRSDMQEVLVIAQFNDWSTDHQQRTLPIEMTRELLEVSRKTSSSPTIQSIQAIYLYKLREVEAAREIWQTTREESALALLCLYWIGAVTELSLNESMSYTQSPYYKLLEQAAQIDRNALGYGETEKLIDNILAFAY